MFELKKWKLDKSGKGIIARGKCYGNYRFPEGRSVHTSCVVKAEVLEEREQILLTTYSGSHYALCFTEFDEAAWETTAKLIKELGLNLDNKKRKEG